MSKLPQLARPSLKCFLKVGQFTAHQPELPELNILFVVSQLGQPLLEQIPETDRIMQLFVNWNTPPHSGNAGGYGAIDRPWYPNIGIKPKRRITNVVTHFDHAGGLQ